MAQSVADQAASKTNEALASPVDAFILFNERENVVESIVGELSSRDISTYFWRRDIPIGERWREVEEERLGSARAVVVFLGSEGWGPNHLSLAVQAQELKKRIIPVLIGDPPKEALGEADGLFEGLRYLDLRVRSGASLTRLAEAIRPREKGRQFSGIINTLVDGATSSALMPAPTRKKTIDKQALSRACATKFKIASARNAKAICQRRTRTKNCLDPLLDVQLPDWMTNNLTGSSF